MNTKHTPGPWKASFTASLAFVESDTEGAVCQIHRSMAKADDNACLISASPDLLDALQVALKAIRELRNQGSPTALWDDVEEQSYSAIAKATGETA